MGLYLGVAVWTPVAMQGWSYDRQIDWVVIGGSAFVGGTVSVAVVRSRWLGNWPSPSLVTAVGLPILAWVAVAVGSLAGDGPDYGGGGVDYVALGQGAVVLGAASLMAVGASHAVDGPLSWLPWTIGLLLVVASIPFLPWLIGFPVLAYGRALMLVARPPSRGCATAVRGSFA